MFFRGSTRDKDGFGIDDRGQGPIVGLKSSRGKKAVGETMPFINDERVGLVSREFEIWQLSSFITWNILISTCKIACIQTCQQDCLNISYTKRPRSLLKKQKAHVHYLAHDELSLMDIKTDARRIITPSLYFQ